MFEFSLVPLCQLAEIRMGQSPDSTYVHEGREQGVPFLQGNAEFRARNPAAKYSCTQPAKIAEQGSSLISVRAPVGETNIADQLYCIGRGLAAVKFHHYGESLGRELLSFNAKKLDKVSQGTTFVAIGGADLRTLLVAEIPDEEAKVLERVLDTLDTQIQKTEALIAKLEKVKEGLLHDLLTHGIDENGQLRPSHEQAPELYKESALGLIPREWSSPLLDEIAIRGSGHTPSRSNPAFWNGDVSWVSLSDSKSLDNVWIDRTAKKISKLGVANSSAVIHPAGTVVLSRDAGIGKSGVIREEMAVSQHFMAWKCGSALDNLFLYYWLQWMKPRFEAIALGSTIQTIGLRYFESLRIPLPPMSEQKKTSSILLRINERIWKEQGAKNKAISEKVGLMDDLLTGRVRVTPLLEQAQTQA